ncbi:MAG: hypothetical protein P8Y53_24470 [Pseudolabrys sp.]
MVAVTCGDARVAAREAVRAARAEAVRAARAEAGAPRKSLLARVMDALIESRMQQANREIARHIHFLPSSLDERGNRLVRIGKTEMPLGGW